MANANLNDMKKKSKDMLNELKRKNKTPINNFRQRWGDLYVELDEKQNEIYAEKSEWGEVLNLANKDLRDEDGQCALDAKILAMHLLLSLEGSQYGNKLLDIGTAKDTEIVKNKDKDIDLRTWALYYARTSSLSPNEFLNKLDDLFNLGLADEQASVRQWTAFVLGDPQKYGEQKKEENCKKVEEQLIKLWENEVDMFVLREVVISLGQIGGYSLQSNMRIENWNLTKVIETAANHYSPWVYEEVPDAIIGIGRTIIKRENLDTEDKNLALRKLMEILDEWLNNRLRSEAQSALTGKNNSDQYTEKVSKVMDRMMVLNKLVLDLTIKGVDDKSLAETTEQIIISAEHVLKSDRKLAYDAYRAAIQAVASSIETIYKDKKGNPRGKQFTLAAKKAIELLLRTAENKKFPEEYIDDVRQRAVDAIRSIVDEEQKKPGPIAKWFTKEKEPLRGLERMLADPIEKVAESVTDTIMKILGYEEGSRYFVNIILNDNDCNETIKHESALWGQKVIPGADKVRMRAALAIASIPESNEAFNQLVDALKSDVTLVAQRARAALEVMGGSQATEALLSERLSSLLTDKFFTPIEEANADGRKLLNRIVNNTITTTWIIKGVALVVVVIGLILTGYSVYSISINPTLLGAGGAVASAVTTIVGLLTSFFWNPANAIEKANKEMVRMITSFHGYMSRMRMLGLGFAAKYTKGDPDTNFLQVISEFAGDAVILSEEALSVDTLPTAMVQVPYFKNKTWDEASTAAKEHALEINIQSLDFDDEVPETNVIDQNIPAGTYKKPGSTVSLKISKGKQDNNAGK